MTILMLTLVLLAHTTACKSNSTNENIPNEVSVTEKQQSLISEVNQFENESNVEGIESEKIVRKTIVKKKSSQKVQYDVRAEESILLIGKVYNLSNDQTKVVKEIEDIWDKFFYEEFYNEIKIVDENIYVVYYDYQKSGFKALFGYKVDKADKIPEGTISKLTPKGNYAIFPLENDSDEAYNKVWKEAEAANNQRSYEAELEVYTMDWNTFAVKHGELRLHLKN